MSGTQTPNLPTFFQSSDLKRSGEIPAADWTNGVNKVGSNAPAIGVNTGDYDPKASDWPRMADTAARESQHIGQATSVVNVDQDPEFNNTTAFVEADAETAPDAVLDATTGATNKTGATVPSGGWAWGVISSSFLLLADGGELFLENGDNLGT